MQAIVEMFGPDGLERVPESRVAEFEARGYCRRDAFPRAQAAPGPAAPSDAGPAEIRIPAPMPLDQPDDLND